MVSIREDYQRYVPPAWVAVTIRRLLDSLPDGYVAGLSAVVLTEATKVGKGKSRRVAGRKHSRRECLGLYRRWPRGDQPAIFIIVDNVLREERLQWLQFARDAMLGEVLFHEIGHHLHFKVGSAGAGDEASAENWERRLWGMHLRKRYWYLRPVVMMVSEVASLHSKWRRLRQAG
jgi:hypothetical protein